MAATEGTDDKPAELTKVYLARVHGFLESPEKDLRKLAITAHQAVVWDMKLDSYRFYQLLRDEREEAAQKRGNHILNIGERFRPRLRP